MITEIAHIKIDPARAADFEAAVAAAVPHFKAAKGCHAMRLERVIEDPAQYRLSVDWETVNIGTGPLPFSEPEPKLSSALVLTG